MTRLHSAFASFLFVACFTATAQQWQTSTTVLLKFLRPISMSSARHVDSYGPAFSFPLLAYDTGTPASSRHKVEHPHRSRTELTDAAVITLNNVPGDINFQSKVSTTEESATMLWLGSPGKHRLHISLVNSDIRNQERRIEDIFIDSKTKLSENEIKTLLKNNFGIEYKENKAGAEHNPRMPPTIPSTPSNH